MIQGKSIAMFAAGDIRVTGGSNIATFELARQLSSRNRIHIISVNEHANRSLPPLPKNITIHFTRAPQSPGFRHLLSPILALRDKLRFEDLDVDIFHFNNCSDLGIITQIIRKPSIVLLHGDLLHLYEQTGKVKHMLKEKYLKPFYRHSLKKANTIIVVTKTLLDFVRYINPAVISKTIIIPNGVNLERFSNPPRGNIRMKYGVQDRYLLLYPARLSAERDHDDLIRAMPSIIKKYPKVTLLLVGKGGREKELKNIAKLLRVDDNVIFAGDVSFEKIPEYYSDADLVFSAFIPIISRKNRCPNSMRKIMNEVDLLASPLVTLEGMASGKPLIGLTPNVAIEKEILDRNEIGILLPTGRPDLLADTIVRMINDRSTAEEIGRNAREYVTNHRTWRIVAEKYSKACEIAIENSCDN